MGEGGDLAGDVPTLDEAVGWCKAWPGSPAGGIPPMPEPFIDDVMADLFRQRHWPRSWHAWVVAAWRKAFRSGWVKKTGATAVSESVRVIEERKELESLKRELAEIERQETEDRLACMPFNAERRARKKVLVAKLAGEAEQ